MILNLEEYNNSELLEINSLGKLRFSDIEIIIKNNIGYYRGENYEIVGNCCIDYDCEKLTINSDNGIICEIDFSLKFGEIVQILNRYRFDYLINRLTDITFREILNRTEWGARIENIYNCYYKDIDYNNYKRKFRLKSFSCYMKKILNKYKKLYLYLKSVKEIKNSNFIIKIDHIIDDDEFECSDYYNVYGYYFGEHYALEYNEFESWLGMKISNELLDKYSYEFIVVHCLWEMTFCGFSNDDIHNRIKEIEERI